MNWLKTSWNAISAALLTALAIFAVASAQRHKKTARKWQDKATEIEQGNVVDGLQKAEQATTQAKLHEEKSRQIKKLAEDKIDRLAKKDEDISEILARWGNS